MINVTNLLSSDFSVTRSVVMEFKLAKYSAWIKTRQSVPVNVTNLQFYLLRNPAIQRVAVQTICYQLTSLNH